MKENEMALLISTQGEQVSLDILNYSNIYFLAPPLAEVSNKGPAKQARCWQCDLALVPLFSFVEELLSNVCLYIFNAIQMLLLLKNPCVPLLPTPVGTAK